MSAHEGVSCDACGKSNFRLKRFKCLICYDYDLCSTCYEQGEISSDHITEHPMQCILTRQDFESYYYGERYTSDQPQSLTCPYCGEMGYSFPYLNESSSLTNQTENVDLFQHVQSKHGTDQQLPEVICPICASMTNGEPNLVTGDLISHIANDHQYSQGNTSTSTNDGINAYTRHGIPNREYDFGIGAAIRGGFRRGSLRVSSRRGSSGRGGNSNAPVSQHFIVDTAGLSTNGNDPIADLLTQLSTVRRIAAANNNNNTNSSNSSNNNSPLSVTPNTINLQALTRQQYERERLRATLGRPNHQHHHYSLHAPPPPPPPPQSSGTSDNLSSVEPELFDALFPTTMYVDSSNSSGWTHILTHPQSQFQQQPTSDHLSQSTSTIKTPSTTNDSDPSLLRRICDQSSSSSSSKNSSIVQTPKQNSDFVQSLLLSSLVSMNNEDD